jgi:hypothetical protein
MSTVQHINENEVLEWTKTTTYTFEEALQNVRNGSWRVHHRGTLKILIVRITQSQRTNYRKSHSMVPPHSHIPPCSFYFSTGPNRITARRIRTCYHASARTFIAIKILSAAKTGQHKNPMLTAFRVAP